MTDLHQCLTSRMLWFLALNNDSGVPSGGPLFRRTKHSDATRKESHRSHSRVGLHTSFAVHILRTVRSAGRWLHSHALTFSMSVSTAAQHASVILPQASAGRCCGCRRRCGRWRTTARRRRRAAAATPRSPSRSSRSPRRRTTPSTTRASRRCCANSAPSRPPMSRSGQ